MDRRRLSKTIVLSSIAAAFAGIGAMVVRAFQPWLSRGDDGRWRLGPRDGFPAGSCTVLGRAQAIVVNDADGLHALSAICTHERCTVHCQPATKELLCPCHGSRFDYRGNVKQGPAQLPLAWLALTVEDGELVLDTSVTVPRSSG